MLGTDISINVDDDEQFDWIAYAESEYSNLTNHYEGSFADLMGFLADNSLNSTDGGTYELSIYENEFVISAEYDHIETTGHLEKPSLVDAHVKVIGSSIPGIPSDILEEFVGKEAYENIMDE